MAKAKKSPPVDDAPAEPPKEAPTAPPGSPRVVPLQKVRDAKGERKIPVARSKVASTRAFRRVRSDRVMGLVGLALVLGALLLLFSWPAPPEKKPPTFDVEWPESTFTPFEERITILREPGTFTREIAFDQANVTRVTLWTNWRDDVGDQLFEYDNISFELTGPTANTSLRIINSATSSELLNETRTKPIDKPPELRSVPARTEAEAREAIGDRSARNGTGTWTLTIRLLFVGDDWSQNAPRDAGQPCPPQSPPGSPVCIHDPGNEVEVRVQYSAYALRLKPGVA